ncbi:N-formylglutamate deformylase [Roseicitreum antarcticum]|uniref:Formiminoglutamase n=1 Tax=Roseicitreum antarcticum TaxID=564137 RepID=A0A1H2VXH7_9RHOB|nr:N-formylglutamate deformylase [Roseicitreum antarcticum]SDW72941.1 formiminoglutamase [Roseicitreum antarcticum]
MTRPDAKTSPVEVTQGTCPLVIAMPHTGTFVPDEVRANLNEIGRGLSDTDWHIDRLYAGLIPGASCVRATFHRYVIDANRDPSGHSLYPGQNTTGLIPTTDFDGNAIWATLPDAAQTAARLKAYHAPYHRALAAELARVKALHGFVILYDCHSIRSRIPFLFDGLLPDMNIGTNRGTTCAPALQTLTQRHCAAAAGLTSVLNGRFLGGWTTRHYGRPDESMHAIQMELTQSAYMAERAPWTWDAEKAARVQAVLGPLLHDIAALDLSPADTAR